MVRFLSLEIWHFRALGGSLSSSHSHVCIVAEQKQSISDKMDVSLPFSTYRQTKQLWKTDALWWHTEISCLWTKINCNKFCCKLNTLSLVSRYVVCERLSAMQGLPEYGMAKFLFILQEYPIFGWPKITLPGAISIQISSKFTGEVIYYLLCMPPLAFCGVSVVQRVQHFRSKWGER